ncbi:MAG: CotH kinase family protein [Pseudomonadota bacterium]
MSRRTWPLLLLILASGCRVSTVQEPDGQGFGVDTIPGEDVGQLPDAPGEVVDTRVDDGTTSPDLPPLDLSVPDLAPGETPALLINEVLTKDLDGGSDWFELLAAGDEAVLLSDYSVVDGDSDHVLHPLPEVWLEPGDLYVVKAIAADDWSPYPHVLFKLGGNDSLTLASEGQLIDRIDWFGQPPPEGTTLCRMPPGASAWRLCEASPGQPNQALKLKLSSCYNPFLWDRATPLELTLEPGAWEAMLAHPEAEEYHPGDYYFDDMHLGNVAIRIKGGSSIAKVADTGTHRFSFKVDFNRYVETQSFCGLRKVVLHNGWGDPTLLREHLAFRLARQLGVPAPRSAFVDLTVAGEHLGIYLMVEPVDDDFFLDENFSNDKGDLYKAGEPAGTLAYRGESFGDYPGFSVENNQDTTDHAALLAFIDVLNHGEPQAWPSVMRVNDTLRYLAWNTVLTNLDSYNGTAANYYLYEQDGVFTPIPWDADEAFGSHDCGCGVDALLAFAVDEPTCGPLADRPLLEKLLSVPAHALGYHKYVKEMLAGGFEPATFTLWKDAAAEVVRPGLEEGVYFQGIDEFEAALADGPVGGPGDEDLIGLQRFVEERNEHLDAQLAGSEPATRSGQGNCTVESP